MFPALLEQGPATGLLLVRFVIMQENLKGFDFQVMALQGDTDIIGTGLQGLLHAAVVSLHYDLNPLIAHDDIEIDGSEIRRGQNDPDASEITVHGLSRVDNLVNDCLRAAPSRSVGQGRFGFR
jgi:hypothetical protein